MRITAELMSKSNQFLNAVGEFHIDLRGLKIPYIENLALSKDQFGCIDLTENDLVHIPILPELKRLKTMILSDNRISTIEPGFSEKCKGIENIVLMNNKIADFSEIDNLSGCKGLKRLALHGNIVTKQEHYRLYCISKIPSLKILDFGKVTLKERVAAREMFGEIKGQEFVEELKKKQKILKEKSKMTKEGKQRRQRAIELKQMIEKAETLEEIMQIEKEMNDGKYEEILKEMEEEEAKQQ
ncbi:unnamed protein product [Moneuplotes crassus]|uniref:Uncharacterized protein n=1 Tax=Euplotes crassus TaxID=5936 RepID=A0AAD2D2W1_EUPCR|nr:unnamed protein product [Moneuplotes crassus]